MSTDYICRSYSGMCNAGIRWDSAGKIWEALVRHLHENISNKLLCSTIGRFSEQKFFGCVRRKEEKLYWSQIFFSMLCSWVPVSQQMPAFPQSSAPWELREGRWQATQRSWKATQTLGRVVAILFGGRLSMCKEEGIQYLPLNGVFKSHTL